MAFAQFYYDPALEFEKLLDESEAQDHNVPAVAQSHATLPGSANSNTQNTSSVAAAQPMYVGEYLFLRKGALSMLCETTAACQRMGKSQSLLLLHQSPQVPVAERRCRCC